MELAPNVGDEAAKLIDKELGQVFNSFLVSNFEDKVKLQKIARECKMDNITIITTEFQHKVYDVSGVVIILTFFLFGKFHRFFGGQWIDKPSSTEMTLGHCSLTFLLMT